MIIKITFFLIDNTLKTIFFTWRHNGLKNSSPIHDDLTFLQKHGLCDQHIQINQHCGFMHWLHEALIKALWVTVWGLDLQSPAGEGSLTFTLLPQHVLPKEILGLLEKTTFAPFIWQRQCTKMWSFCFVFFRWLYNLGSHVSKKKKKICTWKP